MSGTARSALRRLTNDGANGAGGHRRGASRRARGAQLRHSGRAPAGRPRRRRTTPCARAGSSVAGKHATTPRAGKMLRGPFSQPRLVLADTASLATLPRREVRAGYGEIAKYGLIRDADFFEWLEAEGRAVCDLEAAALTRAVMVSCRIKAVIVAADERETGDDRALLNFGHTFGHALQAG